MTAPTPLRAGTPVRALPNVLRQAVSERDVVRFALGEVSGVPDSKHVTVTIAGTDVTVPKLSTYAPTIGEPCYLLTSGYWTLALGTVK
jgi:hypothetical protein